MTHEFVDKRSPLIRGMITFFLLLCPVTESHGQDALMALPQAARAPADNPPSVEKAALGKLLFWDPILSGDSEPLTMEAHPQSGPPVRAIAPQAQDMMPETRG